MATHERLSALDRTFLDLEYTETPMHVAGVMLFDAAPLRTPGGGIDVEKIRKYVASRLHLMPRYRQRIARIPFENHPVWVDDDRFNLEYHVRHTALPLPGGDEQLKRLTGRIISQQLDRGKPLWELWIVEGLDGDRFAMITKTHHCMIDGVAAVDLATVLPSPTPDPTIPDAQPWMPQSAPSRGELVMEEARRRLATPLEIGKAVLGAMQNPAETAESIGEQIFAVTETLGAGMSSASESPFNQPIGPHRRFEWTAIELADVKRVKNALGGTVNDVVLATVAGAVGLFLSGRGFSRKEIAGTRFPRDGSGERARVVGARHAGKSNRVMGATPSDRPSRSAPAPAGGPRGHRRSQRVAAGDGSRGARAGQRVDGGHPVVAGDASGGAGAPVQSDRHQRSRTADPALYDRLAAVGRISRRAAVFGSIAQYRAAQLRRPVVLGIQWGLGCAARSSRHRCGNSHLIRRVAPGIRDGARSNAHPQPPAAGEAFVRRAKTLIDAERRAAFFASVPD